MTIPQHTRGAIDRYVLTGTPTGDFMYNVLINDLGGAVAHADEENSIHLSDIVKFIYNYVPQCCHGSREAVANWLKSHIDKTPIVEQAKTFYKERTKNAAIKNAFEDDGLVEELVKACENLVKWNSKYPSNAIYGHTAILKIIDELDTIVEQTKVALANAKPE